MSLKVLRNDMAITENNLVYRTDDSTSIKLRTINDNHLLIIKSIILYMYLLKNKMNATYLK